MPECLPSCARHLALPTLLSLVWVQRISWSLPVFKTPISILPIASACSQWKRNWGCKWPRSIYYNNLHGPACYGKKHLSLACRTDVLLLATAKVQIPPATSNEGTTFLPVEAQHSASSWSQALTARAPAPPKPPCYSQGCPQLGSYQSSLPAAPPPAFQPCHCWGAAVCTVCHHLGSSRTGLPCTNQAAEHRNS